MLHAIEISGGGIAASVGKREELHCKRTVCEMLCTVTGKVKEQTVKHRAALLRVCDCSIGSAGFWFHPAR